ncbi:TetR/AcrR family transcriptional regulator [Haloactinomyces albus]|uniref:AcrR family transcriptional regulator n=1 Tax=Haloactinomyces albus TaxID=1352928 RepID=A0AAE3ZF30_9ACTN|nr:TetR/AcrR family transcriptional regulator [Haloactinomyces albus]MDR7303768.1 AcrR family transcriptional regulator [Haloactinomyces albus]
MDEHEARERILTAAEELFYTHGLQTVGMANIRQASGVSLKRLYQCFPSKEDLIDSYLNRRDQHWHQALTEHVDRYRSGRQRLLAVFDFLTDWFAAPDFRGCAFINAFGELGAVSTPVAAIARSHKHTLRARLRELATEAEAEDAEALAGQLLVLVEGAIVTASMQDFPQCAGEHTKTAAQTLIDTQFGPQHRACR